MRYIYQPNRGVTFARDAGLQNSRGQYVIFLDADDWWDKQCLEWLIKGIEVHPGRFAAAHGNWAYIDQGKVGIERDSRFSKGEGLRTLLLYNPFPIHAVMVRRDAVMAVGGFQFEIPTLEDWELWLRLAAAGYRFVHVPRLLAFYNWHPGSKSKNVELRKRERLAVLDRFWRKVRLSDGMEDLRPKSYATAHIDFCVSYLGEGDIDSALRELDAAACFDGSVVTDVDTFYRIIYSDQAASAGSRAGWLERSDHTRALHHIELVLAHIADALEGRYSSVDLRSAEYAACHALGLAYYGERRLALARRYLAQALWYQPYKSVGSSVGVTFLKSLLPARFLDTGRKLRHSWLRAR
jgi:tetratricopeptide (TPR) repeat protein